MKQWISCNACGADQFESLSAVDEWTIGKCGACGLVYVNPVPFFAPTSDFSELSRKFSYTQYMHQPVTAAIGEFERRQLVFDLDEIARLIGRRPDWEGHVRHLEIGCGSGASVSAAADLGWSSIGIDIDPELVGEGRERLGADLRCTPLLESGLPDEAFDFIRLRDVIEHLPDPYESLVKVRDLLSPEGIGLIVTPNEGGLVTRVRQAAGRKKTRVATVAPPHHLHGFDGPSLKRICARAGLKVYDERTTTPVDARYVTSNNMRSRSRKGVNAVWRMGEVLGMGAVLVAWVGR